MKVLSIVVSGLLAGFAAYDYLYGRLPGDWLALILLMLIVSVCERLADRR